MDMGTKKIWIAPKLVTNLFDATELVKDPGSSESASSAMS